MSTATPITLPGTPLGGGFYFGAIQAAAARFGLIVAPKAEGERTGIWTPQRVDLLGARSYSDGMANTIAMADANSELAQWALAARIGGFSDWYIPSRDELELLYRNLKPTTEENYIYRGDNPSSIPVGYPYEPTAPAQTTVEAFRDGGDQAMSPEWHHSSTQASASYAWVQDFYDGGQYGGVKSWEARCRLVRRFSIE